MIEDRNDDFGSGDIGNEIVRRFDPISPSRLTASLQIGPGSHNTAKVVWIDDVGDPVHALGIRNYDHQLEYRRPEALASTEPGEWYTVELAQVDWDRGIVGEIRVDGSVAATDVDFLNPATAVSGIRVFVHDGGTGSVGLFDELTVGR